MNASMLAVTVTARQPLALGTTSEVSFFTDSHLFVPGSVLRGALAAAWIAEHGPPTADAASTDRFRGLFDADIRFGPLHPVGSQRVPLSVLRCKYPRRAACTTTVIDQAWETAAACPGCGQRLEPSKGQLQLPAHVLPRRIMRTSIDSKTMRAKDGELYAHAALPAGTVLTGTVFGRDSWLEQPRSLRLGGRRSVGGAADYTVNPTPDPTPPPVGPTLVVRLASPAIFVDVAGRPRLDPDPVLDLPDTVRLDGVWARPQVWSGWHAASRLPKPTEVCAMPGSVYRLIGDPPALSAFARQVLREGVGLRRSEGFGVADIATAAWRPDAASQPPPAGATTPTTGTGVHQRLRILLDLNLQPREHGWLVGALRGLQIEQHRPAGGATPAAGLGEVLDELLTQPTAAGLTGRQREAIRTALADLDPTTLRDLTTLAITTPHPRGGDR